METLKKTVTTIGKAIIAVFGPKLPTARDLAVRVYPKPAYAW